MRRSASYTLQRIQQARLKVLPSSYRARRIMKHVAKRHSLKYVGRLHKSNDTHRVIGGLTASTTHHDFNYLYGAVDSYAVRVVERRDIVKGEQRATSVRWIIVEIDLQHNPDVPHIFIAPNGSDRIPYSRLFRTAPALTPINLGSSQHYHEDFETHYTVYARPSVAQLCESLLTPYVAKHVVAKLFPHAIELHHGRLYVYASHTLITSPVIDALVGQALWLAKALDTNSPK